MPTTRPPTALGRARARRDWYLQMARHARAEERNLLDNGLFRTNARSARHYVMRARTVQREVLFELAWARECGRSAR